MNHVTHMNESCHTGAQALPEGVSQKRVPPRCLDAGKHSVLPCVAAVCCRVLQQCAAVCCSSVLRCVAAVCCCVLQQCVAVCCSSVMPCVAAVCCSVLQCDALRYLYTGKYRVLPCAVCCSSVLPYVAVRWSMSLLGALTQAETPSVLYGGAIVWLR